MARILTRRQVEKRGLTVVFLRRILVTADLSQHSLEAMELDKQDRSARKKHTLERMQEKGETCIDCHKGIAHQLPEGYEG